MSEDQKQKTKRPKVAANRTSEANIYRTDKTVKAVPVFQVRVSRWIDGKQIFKKKNAVGKHRALRAKKELIAQLEALKSKAEGKDIKWKDAVEDYVHHLQRRHQEGGISFNTLNTVRGTLKKHTWAWNNLWLSEITGYKIETFISDEKLKRSISNETRNNILKFIRGVFKRQTLLGRISLNPAFGVYIKGRKKLSYPQLMTREEVFRVLKRAKETDMSWYYVFATAYLSGARSGELFSLKWEDINFNNKTIHIRRNYCWKKEEEKATKGKKDRTVVMNTKLLALLKEIKLQFPNSVYVLPRIPDWKAGKAARALRQLQKELNITPTKFHAFRGCFITHLLSNGVSLVKVQQLVGHDDLKTTSFYVGMLGKELEGATDSLEMDLDSNIESLDEHKKKKKNKVG